MMTIQQIETFWGEHHPEPRDTYIFFEHAGGQQYAYVAEVILPTRLRVRLYSLPVELNVLTGYPLRGFVGQVKAMFPLHKVVWRPGILSFANVTNMLPVKMARRDIKKVQVGGNLVMQTNRDGSVCFYHHK